ncbi:phosphoribosylformylglycinamidine cyclo-ligase [Wenzhouxiangella sp. AB-CW3]|uniref:phosphoribosylformylglycinamidine cyclo-ligase n=1 Tax=Wenzhouxiangella sp. AB-CW3 TaxID=2771012 RepID=UPI00168BA6DC|nr:phosphoribosylformylglycinamidine cyclo-ligase [Wenzhouxiangella sp. AB-CW3]QOC21723.1 phosphoribosylformylglycinamidine cyclo-ligase [Wenzhouxiangella sp. AB-CW3]
MSENKSPGLSYRDAGVDIDAGNALVDRIKPLVARASRPEVLGGLGGFGGLFHLGERFNDPVLVSGTDGVGTKLLLARQMDRHDTIGIDLVAMCVNDILVCGAEPLFFLDYFACGKLEVDAAADVVAGIAEGCRQAHCALIGGETAEMPGMYGPGEYDLAGFTVGAVERSALIDGMGIDEDCVVLGLSSSGPHSNGYSLIRKVIEVSGANLSQDLDGQPLGEALLAPTRIYVPAILDLIGGFDIRGMAHITGGGLTENIVRVIPEHLGLEIDSRTWTPPAVFHWLSEVGKIDSAEMRRTFNMGIGFVLIVPESMTAPIAARLDEPAPVIGRIVRHESGERVRFV